MLRNILNAVEISYLSAREKHPHYVETLPGGVSVITEELGEAAQAVNDYCTHGNEQDKAHAIEELLQVAASCCRLLIEFDNMEARL